MKTVVLTVSATFAIAASAAPPPPSLGTDPIRALEAAAQFNPEGALAEARGNLEKLRASGLDDDHPAVAVAAATLGQIHGLTGNHEEAIRLLGENLPTVSEKMREGVLMLDEALMAMVYANSLEQLDRDQEALVVLEKLLERARETELPRGLKGKFGKDWIGLEEAYPGKDFQAAMLQRIGTLQLEAENWAEAELALKEAVAILEELHPERQPQIVQLREGWEQAARAQGKPIRPRKVGRFANPRTICFEGTDTIPDTAIHSALARSSAFVRASHPSADFEEYLKRVHRCLELGYRKAGFTETVIEVNWDESQDSVVARIEEGPRLKAGKIHISGSKVLAAEELLTKLVSVKGGEASPARRADKSYKMLAAAKKIPPEKARETIMAHFPLKLPEEEKKENHHFLTTMNAAKEMDPIKSSVWEEGEWIDYQQSFLSRVRAELFSAYAQAGHFFPEFEVEWSPRDGLDLMDLTIEVKEEGPAATLGKIHVAGNRTNTREELLDYLGLEEGVKLKGAYIERIQRRLYDSARFLAWQVTPWRLGPDSNEIELLIHVEEHWEAPSLSQELSREQQAWVRFANWFNAEAGDTDDLVFSVSAETEKGAILAELAVGREGFAFTAQGGGHELGAVAAKSGNAEFVIRPDQTKAFRAAFALGSIPIQGAFTLQEAPPANPFSLTSSTVNFQAGFRTKTEDGVVSVSERTIVLGIDPALALAKAGSYNHRGRRIRFQDGQMILESESSTLRIEEATGRFISLLADEDGFSMTGKTEEGAVARIEGKLREMAKDVPNWADGKNPLSLLFVGLGYLGELSRDDEFLDSGFSPEISRRAARRAKRWTPLATALGDALGSAFDTSEPEEEEEFTIPFDTENMMEELMRGANMSMLLGFGLYDLVSKHIEPGTWPEMVIREVMAYLDGNPLYLNHTIETLLADETIGPFGCLLCASLLQGAGHPGARMFVAKARGELSREGFEKDWKLVLRGKAEDDGLGWKLFKALGVLTPEQIDEFLPADRPTLRDSVKSLVSKIRALPARATAEAMATVMGSLWDRVLAEGMAKVVDAAEERMTPKVDARLVASAVNGLPVLRGVVNFAEETGVRVQILPGEDTLENSKSTLLLAGKMWDKGQAANPEMVAKLAGGELEQLGLGGEGALEKLGLNRKQFDWWLGARIAAEVQKRSILAEGKIDDEEVREYYERNPEQFGGGMTAEVLRISVAVEGDGADQEARLSELLQKVNEAGDMDAKVKLFKAFEGGATSSKAPFGLHPLLQKEFAKLPDGGASGIIRNRLAGAEYFHLLLIPGERRPGEAAPFDRVKSFARNYALLEKELLSLKENAFIDDFEEPEDKEPGHAIAQNAPKGEPGKPGLKGLLEKRFGGGKSGESEAGESEAGDRFEWGLKSVVELANEGNEEHIYYLGAYAERGQANNSGMEAAINNFKRAAAGGEPRAMLRLAELYRTGKGLEPDAVKSQEWKEKAFAPPLRRVEGPVAEFVVHYYAPGLFEELREGAVLGEPGIDRETILETAGMKLGERIDRDRATGIIARLEKIDGIRHVSLMSSPCDDGVRLLIILHPRPELLGENAEPAPAEKAPDARANPPEGEPATPAPAPAALPEADENGFVPLLDVSEE